MRNTHHSILLTSLLLSSTLNASNVCENIGEITVTSPSNTPQIIDDTTSKLSIITATAIEESGYTTLSQALGSLAGISISSNGGLGQQTSLYLGGMASKHTLVLIDGIRVNDVTGFGAPFGDLMLHDIAQIEVIKGAQSGVWGADASAGVINIVTKTPSIGTHGSLGIEVGSYGTHKYDLSLSHATNDYYLKLSSSSIETNGFTAMLPSGGVVEDYEKDGYKNKTHSLKGGYSIDENNKILFTHTLIESEGRYDGFDSSFAPDPNSNETVKTNDSFSSINYHHTDSFNELDVFVNNSQFDREYSDGYRYEGSQKEYGIKSKIPYNGGDFLLIGGSYTDTEHKVTLDKTLETSGVFITNTNTFKGYDGKTIFTQSLRYDNYSEFDSKFTGKFGVKHFHEGIKGLVTTANYGTAYTAPTLDQLYAPLYGNSTLKPESVKSYDIGAEYKGFGVSYFHYEIENLIGYDYATYALTNVTGTSKITGFELLYKDEIIENTLLLVAYTNLDATDEKGEKLPYRPDESIKFALDYYGFAKLHLGINGEYVGIRKVVDALTFAPKESDSYTLVNFIANYSISPNLKITLKADNLTDETYTLVDGYATAGQSFTLGVKATF